MRTLHVHAAILTCCILWTTSHPFSLAAEPPIERHRTLPAIAFVVQERLGNPDGVVRYHSRDIVKQWGCSIQVITPSKPDKAPRVLYKNPKAAILDMNISYDAKILFFSMREGQDDNWHIYELAVDAPAGTAPRQVTSGHYHDFSPAELPDGKLVFASTRMKSFNICAQELATGLFSVPRTGNNIQQITVNTLNDMSPHILPNGQILYTRWEYVDRDVKWRQSLWTVNPDGTGVRLYFGNTIRDPAVFWQARPIPGTDEVVATFAPHHGWPLGAIGTATRRYGVETAPGKGYKWITQEYPKIQDNGRLTEWAYRDPFPLNKDEFLVSYGGGLKGKDKRFKLYLLNKNDTKTLIWEDPNVSCTYPLPLSPRKRPALRQPHKRPKGLTTGTFLLQDVYIGLGKSVKRGEIKTLRIMEQVPKFPINESSPRVYEMTPVMGRRSYYIKRCLGVVPVEKDGSAHFTVPALKELYFQALDKNGIAVQSMGSAVNLVPGEKQTCIGCHENRQMAPPSKTVIAAMKNPVAPTPYDWGNNGHIDFVKLVQPVLDKHCAACHSGSRPKGKLNLSGDKTRFFNMAYDQIFNRQLINTVRLTANDSQVIPPKASFAYASRLREYIEGRAPEHTKIILTKEERERIYVWIDSNSNYYGTHERTRPGTRGGRDAWSGPWFSESFTPVFKQNCAACHRLGSSAYPQDAHWINLTNPEHSLALTAHLAKDAGGYGITKSKQGKQPPLHKNKHDAVYTTLLQAIIQGKQELLARPRMDMLHGTPLSGKNDWGTFHGTGDPAEKTPGHFWNSVLMKQKIK